MFPGIYQITNIINNQFYIGSSTDVKRRQKDHIRTLNSNKSHSKLLQKAWNAFKQENFRYKVLLLCSIEELFIVEQYFVDILNPQYNISKIDVRVPRGLPYKNPDNYRLFALKRLKSNINFGWKSRSIVRLDDNSIVLEEYNSLKDYATKHKCAIGNVGKALKKGNRCKGFYIKYKDSLNIDAL